MKARRAIIGGAAALILIAVMIKIFVHSSALLTPAVIPADADAHTMLAPSLDARLSRVYEEFTRHGDGDEHREIALTFDDGPYALTTPLLLATLHDLGVTATFFLIGRDVEEQPEITARLVAQGYEVADHTRNHLDLDKLPASEVSDELLAGSGILARFTPSFTARHYFRPPHGRYTEATIQAAQSLGYDTILWNDDPGDWRDVGAKELAEHIEHHVTAPEILLLHSGHIATIEMLPQIVAALKNAGFTFVTVSRLLKDAGAQSINHPQKIGTIAPAPAQ